MLTGHAVLLGSKVAVAASPPSLVQAANSTGATPTLGATPTAGNLLIAKNGWRGNGSTTVSGWNLAVAVQPINAGAQIHWRVATGGETTTPFTANFAATPGGSRVEEWANMNVASPLDQVSSNSTAVGSTIPCGTTPTTVGGNLVIAACAGARNGVTIVSWDNSFIGVGSNTSFFPAGKEATGGGTFTATATLSGAPGNCGGCIAVFKGA